MLENVNERSVPPKYSNLSVIIEVARILSAPLLAVTRSVHRPEHPRLAVPNLRSAPAGEPRLTATTGRTAAVGAETAPADARRSPLLGRAAAPVGGLEIRSPDRPSRDSRRLAPERLSSVLEVEDTPWKARSAQ